MKFFTNKSIWTKIAIILIFVLVFEFIIAKPTLAADGDLIEFGGKLMTPVLSLVVTLNDSIMGVIHSAIMGVTEPLMEVDMDSTMWEKIGRIFVWVLAAAVVVGAFLLTGGLIGSLLVGIAVGYYGNCVVDDIGSEHYSRCADVIP